MVGIWFIEGVVFMDSSPSILKISRDRGLQLRMMLTLFAVGLLYAVFAVVMWQLGIALIWIAPIIGIVAILQYFFSDKIALAAMRAKTVSEEDAPDLHAMVARLASRVGIPKPTIAVIRNDIPNAFATGRNPSKAVVAVTEGIVHRLTPVELEAVLGHELAHVVNRDMRVLAISNFFVTAVGFISGLLLYSLFFQGMFGGRGSSRNEGISIGLALLAAYVATLVLHFLMQLLVLALTRYREYGADDTGAQISGNPTALASALAKISQHVNIAKEGERSKLQPASALLFIPSMRGVAGLFSTHPPVEERIRRLQKKAKEMAATPVYKRYTWQR